MRFYISFILITLFSITSCKPRGMDDDNSSNEYKLDAPIYFGERNFSNNNPLTAEGINLGRHLFYEKALSLDSSISCSSCHLQKFGFSDTARFSKGVHNKITTRKSMGLSNLAWQTKFFWDGRATSLEMQALAPIEAENEMNLDKNEAANRLNQSSFYKDLFNKAFNTSKVTPELIAKAIAQFERTIVSGNSKYDLYKQGKASLSTSELRGEQLFFTHPEPSNNLRGGNCGDCHSGALTSNNQFSNNGLDSTPSDIGLEKITNDSNDKGKFKIVSLRNIALHPPFMHDGRFNSLEEVLDHYNEHIQSSPTLDPQITQASNTINGIKLDLTNQEKQDIIAFLKTLTDESLINNKNLTNPFK